MSLLTLLLSLIAVNCDDDVVAAAIAAVSYGHSSFVLHQYARRSPPVVPSFR